MLIKNNIKEKDLQISQAQSKYETIPEDYAVLQAELAHLASESSKTISDLNQSLFVCKDEKEQLRLNIAQEKGLNESLQKQNVELKVFLNLKSGFYAEST